MTAPAPTTFAAVLRAELTRRCARNPSYSLRAFARALDVDHATLSQILRGKRALTRDTILELGKRLGLEGSRLEAFVRDAEAVRDGPPAYSPSLDAAAIVGEPLHHQLLALTHTEDFRGESAFLAQVLDTTPDAINVVLQRLLRFGLLRMTEGRWLDVTGAGELDPEGFERAVWDHAARRVVAASAAPSAALDEDATAPHPVRQFQILARDPEATAVFYQRVFGWEIDQRNALGVRQLSTGAEGMAGGIWPTPPEGKPLVQLFIDAADLESTVSRAHGLGAQVVVPPQALPDGDALAILVDPEGRPFGVYRSSPGRRP
jgi:predicted enzyme related to lactoylglutathione lyase/transcriptional regulator with XRE-family HTH domain